MAVNWVTKTIRSIIGENELERWEDKWEIARAHLNISDLLRNSL
jgi:hypothetical protein